MTPLQKYPTFEYAMSVTIAQLFLKKEFRSKTEKDVCAGLYSDSTDFEVNGPHFKMSFQKFCEFANTAMLQSEEKNINLEAKWESYSGWKGSSLLEIFVSTILRKNKRNCDLIISKREDLKYNFHFVESSTLFTRRPVEFQPIYHDSFEHVQELLEGQYAIAYSDSVRPVLASAHFADCVGFIAFSESPKIGIVAHIHDVHKVENKNFYEVNSICISENKIKRDYVRKFFEDIKQDLSNVTNLKEMGYVLVGGTNNNLKDDIKLAASQLTTFKLNFNKWISTRIVENSFLIDSNWGPSVRLSRSVALDTRQTSFEESLKSYEPRLYPQTAYKQIMSHDIKKAKELASERQKKIEEKPEIQKVYNGLEK